MKYCPKCQQTYPDESLNFCLTDGQALLTDEIPANEETVIKPSFVTSPVQNITTGADPQLKPGVNPIFAYLLVGLLALIAGGAIMAWLKSDSSNPVNSNQALTDSANESNRPQTTPAANQIKEANQVKTSKPTPDQTPLSKDDELMISGAKAALNGWVQTPVDHNYEQHMTYYANYLDYYNKKKNADILHVREVNQKLFNKYSQFRLEIRNIKATVLPDGQVMTTFESVYDFRGPKAVHSGIDRGTEMRWKKIDGSWKIVSER